MIFGSRAAKFWFPDFRECKDTDIISKEGKSTREIEYHWVPGYQHILDNNLDKQYVDPDFLYTVKVSHAAWDVRWDKTMLDIEFLKSKSCKLDSILYKSLLKDWEIVHHKKKVALKGTAEQFFNSNVTRKMDHDELHQLVKFYDRPLHEKIRLDINDVKVSKTLWDSLSYEDQLKCSLEEAYVFALERYSQFPPNLALIKALKHLITQSTKGYFNLFLIENFDVLRKFDKTKYLCYYYRYKEIV